MNHVTVKSKIIIDNTGVFIEIPIIITDVGPLEPLLDYLLELAYARSFPWMQKMTQSVGLILDYIDANQDCFDNPKSMFQSFAQHLYCGTVGEDGMDPSNLFWSPKRGSLVRQLVNQLSQFSDWLSEKRGAIQLNPWRSASRFEEMLNWASYLQKHKRGFLAHVWSREKAYKTAKTVRHIQLRRLPIANHNCVKHFPQERLRDLLFDGFIVPGKQKMNRIDENLNIRDILITLLMHCGGLRVSEPFHLYVHDVILDPNPDYDGHAMVRVFHPTEGLAPDDWYNSNGEAIRCNREAYLRGKYGKRPRNLYYSTDQLHAGWKNNTIENSACFMYVYWCPQWAGKMFWNFWNMYIVNRAMKDCQHPFAFITKEGKPYSPDSFAKAHSRAVERIGMKSSKKMGTTPHGHRHAYGQRLADLCIEPSIIKKMMHHSSLESQNVYTQPSNEKVTGLLNSINQDERYSQHDFHKYGFTDRDLADSKLVQNE